MSREQETWSEAGLWARMRGALSSALAAPFASASGRWRRLRGASLAASSIPPAPAASSFSPGGISRTLVRALEEEEQMDEVSLYPMCIDVEETFLGSRDVDAIFSAKPSTSNCAPPMEEVKVIEPRTPDAPAPTGGARRRRRRCVEAMVGSAATLLHRGIVSEQRWLFARACARRSRLAVEGLLTVFWGLVVCGFSLYIISVVVNGTLDDTIEEAVKIGDWRYAVVSTVAVVLLLFHGAYVVFGALLMGASKASDLPSERKRDRIPEFLLGSCLGFCENGIKETQPAPLPPSALWQEEKSVEEELKSLAHSREGRTPSARGSESSAQQQQHSCLDRQSSDAGEAQSSSINIPSSSIHPHEVRTHVPYSRTPSRPTLNIMSTRSSRAFYRSISEDDSVVRCSSSSSFPPHSSEFSASTSSASGRASFASCTNTEEWTTPPSHCQGFFDCVSESSLTDQKGAMIPIERGASIGGRISEFFKRLSRRNVQLLKEGDTEKKKDEGVSGEKGKLSSSASCWLKSWLITASINFKLYFLLSVALGFMGYYTVSALVIPVNVSLFICIVDVFAELCGVSETLSQHEQPPVPGRSNDDVGSSAGFSQDPSMPSQIPILPMNESSPLIQK